MGKLRVTFKDTGLCYTCRVRKRHAKLSYCKECFRAWHRKYYRRKTDRQNFISRCAVCQIRYDKGKKRINGCVDCSALAKIRFCQQLRKAQQKKLGILNPPSLEEYNSLLNKAKKKGCPCCGRKNKKKRWHLHHNHKTGKWIGLICSRCNMAFGQLEDTLKLMRKAFKWFRDNH